MCKIGGVSPRASVVDDDPSFRNVVLDRLTDVGYQQTKASKFLRIPRHLQLHRAEKYQIPLRGNRS